MKTMINRARIEGVLYESTLEEKTFEPGTQSAGQKYVSGNLSIEVEEDNVITIEIFENEITRAGNRNQKYDKILSLIDANSIVSTGRDNAVCLRVDSDISLNDWYPNGQDELVSTMRNFNGFINFLTPGNLQPQATFDLDILITSTMDETKVDEDGIVEPTGALIVKGYIFDFAKRIMPVELLVENEAGVEYFRDMETNTFTKVWGRQVNKSNVVKRVEESAFGDDKVVEYTNVKKKFLITGTNKEPYAFGEEGILTVEEVQEAIAQRNVYLADRKSRSQKKGKTTEKADSVVTDPTTATFTF